jgi:dihydroxyacid dehydratase/phosphogluconate dehydratase
MKNQRSHQWFDTPGYYGLMRRAWFRSQGLPADTFDGKPIVGICNSWSELNNCNAHLRDLAYPIDAVVLLCGCDSTTPAQLMGTAFGPDSPPVVSAPRQRAPRFILLAAGIRRLGRDHGDAEGGEENEA